jgi:hypothetical protein
VLHHFEGHCPKDRSKLVDALRPVGLIEEGRGSRVRGRGGEKKKTFRGKKTAEHITFIVD